MMHPAGGDIPRAWGQRTLLSTLRGGEQPVNNIRQVSVVRQENVRSNGAAVAMERIPGSGICAGAALRENMKAMSKAELELEKLISKLEGQLASAHYALKLMRSKTTEIQEQTARLEAEASAVTEEDLEPTGGIPLFS
jgi:hypothetical protein